jgi:YgiT-type zinc finger domain-containing protein
MTCIHCEGQMEKGTAPFHVDRNGYHLLLDTVAAWVCQQCGEVYFEETEVDSIQALIQTMDTQLENLAVSV